MQTIVSILPVLLLVVLGILIRQAKIIQKSTIDDFQKLVVNITLPLLLFIAFSTMVFEVRYLLIVITVFLACTLVMILSSKSLSIPGMNSVYSSFLIAGFEAGMLGYAIFGTMYGKDNIPKFAVVDLGQVIFVFFVLVTRLENLRGVKFDPGKTFIKFLKSPVIIGILAGIVFNITGIYRLFTTSPITSSLLATADILAGLTTPLVAIVIGYGLTFEKGQLVKPLQTVILRLLIWISLALVFNYLVIKQFLGLDRVFEAAVLIMAILPAPFVVPFYLREDDPQDRNYILNTLTIGTIAALIGSTVIGMIY